MRNYQILNQLNINILKLSFFLVPLFFFFVFLLLWMFALKVVFSPQEIMDVFQDKPAVNKAILVFVLLLLFSVALSPNRWISFQAFLLSLSYLLFYFLVKKTMKHKKMVISISHLLFFVAFIMASYTLIQYYKLDPFLKGINQLTSTIGQRNWIANYLYMVTPLIFIFFLLEKRVKTKLLYLFLLSIIYINFIILQSRSIWIVIALTGIAGLLFLFKLRVSRPFLKNRHWLLLFFIIIILITWGYSTTNHINRSPSFMEERVLPALKGEELSVNQHFLSWYTAWKMFLDRPLFGWGIGNFKMKFLSYQAEAIKAFPVFRASYQNAQEAHNEYLQLLAETGIIGLVAFLLILYLIAKKCLSFLFCDRYSKEERIIMLGLMMGISGFLMMGLFGFPMHVPALGMTFFGLLGLSTAYADIAGFKESREKDCDESIQKNNTQIFPKKCGIFLAILFSIAFIYLINMLVFRPYYAEMLHFQGLRHNVDRNDDLAREKFEKSYRFNHYDGKNLHALGAAYLNKGDYEKAEYYLISAKHYLNDINTYLNLGLVYSKTGQYKKAEEEYKQALYLHPGFSQVYHYLGQLYFEKKAYDHAIEAWKKLIELEPDLSTAYIIYNNLGIAYEQKQETEKALDYFEKALSRAPENNSIREEIEKKITGIQR